MPDEEKSPLARLAVCSFESRKAPEMRLLIEKHGGSATVAPSMQEIPLDQNLVAFEFFDALVARQIDIVIFMTGVGARALREAIEVRFDGQTFLDALRECTLVVRGPKPSVVLREWGLPVNYRAAEPNTWRELLQIFDKEVSISGKKIAVQEYGRPNVEFYEELEKRGATVMPVPVYRWELPDDTGPLEDAIRATIEGRFDVLLITSANQIDNILAVAETLNLQSEWLAAAGNCVVASIGPTASERIREAGLTADMEPSHPKMAHLVREALQETPRLLAAKRASRPVE